MRLASLPRVVIKVNKSNIVYRKHQARVLPYKLVILFTLWLQSSVDQKQLVDIALKKVYWNFI